MGLSIGASQTNLAIGAAQAAATGVVAPIAKWATRTGHRFTDSADTLSIDVLAETNYTDIGSGGEGGIKDVVFTVNGTPQTPITSRSRRTPNYNETVSPITGTTKMSDIFAFGFDLNAADYSNGTITISAVVTTNAGSTTTLDEIKVYNNKDSDTRPSTKVIYVSPTGSDSNDGLTTSTPVLNIQTGFELCATSGDMGGAEVVLMPGQHDWAGYAGWPDGRDIFTSDHWWVRMRVQDGATIEKPGTMSSNGAISFNALTNLNLEPTGAQEDRINWLMILEGSTPQITRGGPMLNTPPGCVTTLAVEGGVFGHPAFDASTNKWSVRFAEEKVRLLEHVQNGNAGDGTLWATNVTAQGTDNAFIGIHNAMDVKAEYWTGICWQSTSTAPSQFISNAHVNQQRYGGSVNGVLDARIDSGMSLEVVDSNTLRLRRAASSDIHPLGDYSIPDESSQLDLDRHATELVDSLRWGIALRNGSSGPVIFDAYEVTAAGADGSEYTVTLNAPSHGVSAISDLGGYFIYCASRLSGSLSGGDAKYKDLIHPDVFQFPSANNDTLCSGVRITDCIDTRIWASQSVAITRLALVNCADDGTGKTDMSPTNGLDDCLFFHCNFYNIGWGSGTRNGINEARNCVFGAASSYGGSGVTFDGCHFIDAADVQGTNTSSGSWYETDPSGNDDEATADNFTPTVANQGTLGSSPTVAYPTDYTFADAGGDSSKGAWRDTAEAYQLSASNDGTGSGSNPVTQGSGSGSTSTSATGSGSNPVTQGSGSGSTSNDGSTKAGPAITPSVDASGSGVCTVIGSTPLTESPDSADLPLITATGSGSSVVSIAPIAKWATRTGHRFTSSDDTLSIDVLAETNYTPVNEGGAGGIADVTFTVNGVGQTPITSRSRRTPNYNETVSPITGTTKMADIFAYGFDLNAADYANGTITISAVVTTVAGGTTTLDEIKVYNNKDSDTRPSTKVIYVSPTGSDSNDGLTTSTPVENIQTGFELCATSGDMGGAEVVLMPGQHDWAGYSAWPDGRDIFTSDHWWVRLRVQDGATIYRNAPMTDRGQLQYAATDILNLEPTGAQDDIVNLLFVIEGTTPWIARGGPMVNTPASTATTIAFEGGVISHPTFDESTNPWSVRFREIPVFLVDHVSNGSAGSGTYMATNVTARGVVDGIKHFHSAQDVKCEYWLGLAHQTSSVASSQLICNSHVTKQRYGDEINGRIDFRVESGLSLEVVDANTLRLRRAATSDLNPLGQYAIPDTSQQIDFERHLPELLASDFFGVLMEDGAGGPLVFDALSVSAHGPDGSEYTITLDAPSHGLSAIADLNDHYIRAAAVNYGIAYPENRYNNMVHPDVLQFYHTNTDFMVCGLRVTDSTDTRIFASQTVPIERLAVVNCADDGLGKTDMQPGGGLNDSLFFHNSFYHFDFSSGTRNGIVEFRNNVVGPLFGYSGTGVTFDGNHFIDAADVQGTNTSTGSWYETDPSVSGDDFTPTVANQGTLGSSPTVAYPTDYTFSDAGGSSTKGAWRDTAQGYQFTEDVIGSGGTIDLPVLYADGQANYPTFTVRLGATTKEGYYVHVIDDNSQTNYNRTWNWGDGSSTDMTGIDFWPFQTHRYESPGTYDITLADQYGGISDPLTVTVNPETPVTSSITYSPLDSDTFELEATLANHSHFSITDGKDLVGGSETYDYDGPLDESWRSNKFVAHTVDSDELFVYGYERPIANTLTGQIWKGNDATDVEQSWLRVGSTGATTVVVGLADSTPITDVVVYPKNICNVIVAAGAAYVTVPYNKRVRVEVNGDRRQALHIFNNKPNSVSGVDVTDWATKVSSVVPAINAGLATGFVWSIPEIGTTYNVGDQFRALFTADTMPSILAGEVRDYEILTAEVVSTAPRVVKLIDHNGTEVEIDSDGSGHKLSLVDYTDTVNTLYFGRGVHKIGRLFRVANNVDVYLGQGAVVIGTFDFRLRNADGSLNDPATQSTQGRGQGITVRGPGILSGSFVGRDELDNGDSELNAGFTGLTSGSSARSYYSMFYNEASGGLFTSNSCKEITVVAQPYHLETGGAFSIYDNFQIVAPWYYNADGPQLYRQSSSSTGPTSIGSITDSFLFCGDDCLKLVKYGANLEVSGCFMLSVGNSPMSGGYWPRTGADTQTVTVSDCDILAFGHGDNDLYQNAYDPGNPSASGVSGAPLGSRCLFRAMTDGAIGEETYNATNYTVDNIRVWGASTQRPFCIGNIRYPFGGSGNMQNQRDQRGYADNITLSNWYFEHPFTQQGVIDAYDADNKPSNITISNWNVAGTLITSDNYDEWFTVDSLVDDMTWDAPGTVANLGDTSPQVNYSAGTYTAKVRASNMSTSTESSVSVTSPAVLGVTGDASLFLYSASGQGDTATSASASASLTITSASSTDANVVTSSTSGAANLPGIGDATSSGSTVATATSQASNPLTYSSGSASTTTIAVDYRADLFVIQASGAASDIESVTATGQVTFASLDASGAADTSTAATGSATTPSTQSEGNAPILVSGSASLPLGQGNGQGETATSGSGSGSNPSTEGSGVSGLVSATATGSAEVSSTTAVGVALTSTSGSGGSIISSLEASGISVVSAVAIASASTGQVTASGSSSTSTSASGSATLGVPLMIAVETGTTVTSTGQADVPSVDITGSGSMTVSASGAASTLSPSAFGGGSIPAEGTAQTTAPTSSGSAQTESTATGSATNPSVTSSGTAVNVEVAQGEGLLSVSSASGSGENIHTANGSPSLPSVVAQGPLAIVANLNSVTATGSGGTHVSGSGDGYLTSTEGRSEIFDFEDFIRIARERIYADLIAELNPEQEEQWRIVKRNLG